MVALVTVLILGVPTLPLFQKKATREQGFSTNLSATTSFSKEKDASLQAVPLNSPWEHVCAFTCTGHEKGILESATALHRQFSICCARPVVPELIVGPESCLPCALNNEPSLSALFDNSGSCRSPLVLIGSRREEARESFACTKTHHKAQMYTALRNETPCHKSLCKNVKCFNTAYILQQGRITSHYDKLFPVPFLETNTPNFCKSLFLYDFFFPKQKVSGLFFSKGNVPYSAGTKPGTITLTLGGVTYNAQLALCSDFFCTNFFKSKICSSESLRSNHVLCVASIFEQIAQAIFSFLRSFTLSKNDSLKSNPLLIVLTHDSWFYGLSVATCMHRYAVLWAVHHQIPVLYVGNYYASWIEPSGRAWPLAPADS
jgi:hypothetical protein